MKPGEDWPGAEIVKIRGGAVRPGDRVVVRFSPTPQNGWQGETVEGVVKWFDIASGHADCRMVLDCDGKQRTHRVRRGEYCARYPAAP